MNTIEQLQLIEDLFQDALTRDPSERLSFINNACPNEPALAAEVLALLAEHTQTAGPLDAQPQLFATGSLGSSPSDHKLQPGSIVSHYRILNLLGKGAMGEVYLAEDNKLERQVALKLLPTNPTASGDHLRRFAREARALSALNHPNILTIYDVDETDGIQYIVTELVDGQTLRKMIADSRFELAQTVEVAVQIASALTVAHKAGVVHRDIKPENVMLRPDGIVKVLDFGLAKLTGRSVREGAQASSDPSFSLPGMLVGTPAYMSPEQASGQQIDARSDIFSFGVVLYEMIAGQLPFQGSKLGSILAAILNATPEPLIRYALDCPPALQAIIDRMLAKGPDQRYASAQEILRDLRRVRRSLGGEEGADQPSDSQPKVSEPAPAPVVADAPTNIFTSIMIRSASFGRGLVTSGKRLLKLTEPGRPYYVGIAVLMLILVGIKIIPTSKNTAMIDSLAVLPFEKGEGVVDYLPDNLTDSLIDALSRMPNLKVISRESVDKSVKYYEGKEVDLIAVGSTLNVKALLTGKMIREGDDIYIEIELFNAHDRSLIWGRKYKRKNSELMITPEIGRDIAQVLGKKFGPGEIPRYHNPEAQDLYRQGRVQWSKRSKEARDMAIEKFRGAIALDPKFALAYDGLADTFLIRGDHSNLVNFHDAEEQLKKAFEIDSDLAEAYATRGYMTAHREMDWVKVDEDFNKALELKPSYATAHHWYADTWLARGNFEEAQTQFNIAQLIDPLSDVIKLDVGLPYFYNREYQKAADHFRDMSDQFPSSHQPPMYLGMTYLLMGMKEDGIAQLQKALKLAATKHTQVMSMLGYAYAVSGQQSKALAIIRELDELKVRRYVSPQRYAMIYVGLGRKNEAFKYLNQAYEEHDFLIMYVNIFPLMDSLRDDPGFAELVRRMNLEPILLKR